MIYKFRAECEADMLELMRLLPRRDIVKYNIEPDFEGLPDVEVEIEFHKLQIDSLRNLMRKVIVGHVMVQTVMPIEEYTGERNYDL